MVVFQIGWLKVGGVQTDAGLFLGQNMQNGWDAHSKSNSAGSSASGDFNYYPSMIAIVNDPDWIDVPINDQDIKSPTLAHIMGV